MTLAHEKRIAKRRGLAVAGFKHQCQAGLCGSKAFWNLEDAGRKHLRKSGFESGDEDEWNKVDWHLERWTKRYWSMAVFVVREDQIIFHILDMEKSNTVRAFFFPGLKVWVSSNNFTSNGTGMSESRAWTHGIKIPRVTSSFYFVWSNRFVRAACLELSLSFWIHILMDEVDLLAGCFLPECAKEAPSSTRGDGSAFLCLCFVALKSGK